MSTSADGEADKPEPPPRRRSRRRSSASAVARAAARAPVEATTEPDEASPPARRLFRIPSQLPSIPQIAALVGLIASILGVVFILFPAWRPDPPQDIGSVDVSDVRVRQPVTFGRYLQRLKLPPGGLSDEFLRRRGVMIEFQLKIEGFKDKQLPLRWELSDAATNDAVDEDQAVSIKPSTNSEGRTWFVWAPAPETTGRYYVTVTIYQPPKGDVDVPLDAFDSPEFTGLAAP